jgi:hypothetical protein
MDITPVFGTVVLGSSPGRCTIIIYESILRRYGLVVEYVLAKDETGVRFSLSAQYKILNVFIGFFVYK